jgi:hypothetical protein
MRDRRRPGAGPGAGANQQGSLQTGNARAKPETPSQIDKARRRMGSRSMPQPMPTRPGLAPQKKRLRTRSGPQPKALSELSHLENGETDSETLLKFRSTKITQAVEK